MRLTSYTDYAIRALIFLGAQPGRLCSTAEIAEAYGISKNHMMKVVNDLARAGYIDAVRGRAGGVRLARAADQINIGEVVRRTECDFDLVDCPGCAIRRGCGLTGVLREALLAFLGVLDRHTLADLLREPAEIRRLLSLVGS